MCPQNEVPVFSETVLTILIELQKCTESILQIKVYELSWRK
jgi:hypothetical protein